MVSSCKVFVRTYGYRHPNNFTYTYRCTQGVRTEETTFHPEDTKEPRRTETPGVRPRVVYARVSPLQFEYTEENPFGRSVVGALTPGISPIKKTGSRSPPCCPSGFGSPLSEILGVELSVYEVFHRTG